MTGTDLSPIPGRAVKAVMALLDAERLMALAVNRPDRSEALTFSGGRDTDQCPPAPMKVTDLI